MVARVQQALALPTKKEAEGVVEVVVAALEATLLNNLERMTYSCLVPHLPSCWKRKEDQVGSKADWLTEQGINTEEHLKRAIGGRLTFGQQAEEWLHNLRTRNREPIPETSVPSIRSALNCWLLPNLGEMPLSEVGNKALRGLVDKMKGHLSAKTMDTYVNMAKEIVESLLDEEGEPI